jgi:hypothetical protein
VNTVMRTIDSDEYNDEDHCLPDNIIIEDHWYLGEYNDENR